MARSPWQRIARPNSRRQCPAENSSRHPSRTAISAARTRASEQFGDARQPLCRCSDQPAKEANRARTRDLARTGKTARWVVVLDNGPASRLTNSLYENLARNGSRRFSVQGKGERIARHARARSERLRHL